MTLDLIMPDLYQEITVKIIDLPYIKGNDVFVKVIMWGDPKKYEFEIKIGKTLWLGIYTYLRELEDDPLNGFMGEASFKIDEQLSFLKDRILTIRGVPDEKHSFVGKDGKIGYSKIFKVEFQSDLEDAEKVGKDTYKEAVFNYVIDRPSCRECRLLNTQMAKEYEEKQKEKDKKKEKTVEIEQDWVKRKRIEKAKEAARLKKLEYSGW